MITTELVKKCLQNDNLAQRELYNKLSVDVMKVCQRFCTKQIAQDAFQNSFCIIFQKLNQWDSTKGTCEAWAYRVSVNASLAELRKEKRYSFLDIQDEVELKDLSFNLNDNLEYKDLKVIIDELSEGQKLIFNLFAIEGFSHKEISESLGITEGTSKSQLAKARVNLKRKYDSRFIEIG